MKAQGMDHFDYIIVGGGTAGCVLAERLTANGRYRVLMLEAGGRDNGFWIPIPAGFPKLLTGKRFNWRFETEREDNTYNRSIVVPRGKGLPPNPRLKSAIQNAFLNPPS
jgi:choline dehydrogenase-like flavoprotein